MKLSHAELGDLAGLCDNRKFSVPLLAVTSPQVKPDSDRMGYTAVGDFAAVALHQTGVSFCTREHFGRRQPGEERQYIRLAYSGIEVADIREGLGRLNEWISAA